MPSKKKAPAKTAAKPKAKAQTQAARLMELAKTAKGGSEGKFAKQVGKATMVNEARKATKMK